MNDILDQIEKFQLSDLEYILLEDPSFSSLLNRTAKQHLKAVIREKDIPGIKELLRENLSVDQIRGLMRELRQDTGMVIPPSNLSTEFWSKATYLQLIYSVGGLILGLACIIGGIILFLRGVTGSTSWTARFIGAESSITDAAPGAILFIVGLFMVFVTRFNVKAEKKRRY